MSLTDAFLLEPAPLNIWIAYRTDGLRAPDLVARNNRLEDPNIGKAPSFVHGLNNWELSKAEQWISALP